MPGPGGLFVTGATGFIGRHLVAYAVARGHPVTVLARDPSRSSFPSGLIKIVPGDLTDIEALRTGVRGAQAAIHLAAVTRAVDTTVIQRVNVDGTRALIDACRAERVTRIIALSSLSVRNAVVGPYAASKRQMEEILLDAGTEVVVMRPGLVYGPGERGLFSRMTRLIETLPFVPIIGRGTQPVYPIHVSDLVEMILRCASAPDVGGRCYDVAGPDTVSLSEFMARVTLALGFRKRQIRVPVVLAWLAAKVMGRLLDDPPLTVDNIVGASQVTACYPLPAWRDLGVRAMTLGDGLATIRDPVPLPGGRVERPLRIAVVGLGKMGITHTAILSMLPGIRVAALVDSNPRRAAVLRGMGFQAPFFSSLGDAIAHVRPAGVVIATPTHQHAPLAMQAASHGIGVLIEKPLAESLGQAADMAAHLDRAGVPASCGYTLAYVPTFEKMKELLDAGVLQRIDGFSSSMFLSEVFGPKTGWRYQASRAGGGVLPNLASHLLFLLHWFFGEAERVEARTERLFTETDDSAHVRLFIGGLTGTVETSWSVGGYPLSRTEISVEGENGRLHGNDLEVSITLHRPAGGLPAGETRFHAADLPGRAAFDIGGEGYFLEDASFVESLRTGHPVRTSIARALQVQATIDAIYRSAAAGGSTATPRPVAHAIQPVGA